jgi:3-isopropylmalate dehydrogenase
MANPLATLSSFSMMLRYSLDLQEEADLVDQAVSNILAGGMRTADIMQPGKAKVSTSVLSDAIIGELDKLNA